MEELKVSVVIPNYNGSQLLKQHLPSVVEASKKKVNKIIEIIVIDDNSTDDSLEVLKNNFSEVKVIEQSLNKRFAATVNLGVKKAAGNLICLLNSDVSVSEKFLTKAFEHFSDQKLFGISLHEEGESWPRGLFRNGFVEFERGKVTDQAHSCFWISGGSSLFRKKVWDKLGGMDSGLFSPFYWEDIDVSYRAMKRGYKLLWIKDTLVFHKHESTNKKFESKYKLQIQERNQLLFMWKNITSKRLLKKHLSGLVKRVISGPGYIVVIVKALLFLPLVIKKRRIEKRESKITDESIFASFL